MMPPLYHLKHSEKFPLYAVSRFFVEIEYELSSNEIIGKRSFVAGAILDKSSNLGSVF